MKMISIEQARDRIERHALPLGTEIVELSQSRGRVLAVDMVAGHSVPPFNRSPLDGFAFAAADTRQASEQNPAQLQVAGMIGAGEVWTQPLLPGQCLRIMTGAPVPDGADAVAALETVAVVQDTIQIGKPYRSGENVARAGEDIEAGSLVMTAGTRLEGAQAGVLASLGAGRVPVYQQPRVAVMATGTELVPVGSDLPPGKIYDSNSAMVSQLVAECGAAVVLQKRIGDGRHALTAAIQSALAGADVLITTGGVSVGDYDLTRDAVAACGAEILFHRVAMKPGTPMLAAIKDNKLILCLSGNPAAAFITYRVFVQPALMRMQGYNRWRLPVVAAALTHPLEKRGRQDRFIRAKLRWSGGAWFVGVTGRERPGVLSSLQEANALIFLPSGTKSLAAGDTVDVWLFGRTQDLFA
jgi:molybdopterin molybdotransferase